MRIEIASKSFNSLGYRTKLHDRGIEHELLVYLMMEAESSSETFQAI
jgi:hypothetical protein